MRTEDVKVGDKFRYTTPSGRDIIYTVTALDQVTPQGVVMPVSVSSSGRPVYIHDELLAQEWWQPLTKAT